MKAALAAFLLPLALAGCELFVPSQSAPTQPPQRAIDQGGAGPPPGRTEAERQARKDYYGGPRGDEW